MVSFCCEVLVQLSASYLFIYLFLAAPADIWNSWARDQTFATAVIRTAAVTMPDP